ncbi:hypothetical protein M3Y97_00339500 [Aphelenchoides bicaudatus]|nr:hypothetical protein M3Y97_00339500 [Aphelenchoides bicaudatus]
MRSAFALLISCALVSSALSAVVAKPRDKDLQSEAAKIHLLCKPCQKFFTELKKDLPDVATITEEVLKSVINTECESLDWIPFVDKICEKVLDWGLDKLFNLIVNEDGKIDPQHDCQALKMC